jgi:hypothetical protein
MRGVGLKIFSGGSYAGVRSILVLPRKPSSGPGRHWIRLSPGLQVRGELADVSAELSQTHDDGPAGCGCPASRSWA